jgi:hypothetical protein
LFLAALCVMLVYFSFMRRGTDAESPVTSVAVLPFKPLAGARRGCAYHIALVHHAIGEDAETLRWLERGYAERDVRMVFIGVDPLWDGLRPNRGFEALVKRMNFAR